MYQWLPFLASQLRDSWAEFALLHGVSRWRIRFEIGLTATEFAASNEIGPICGRLASI